MNRRAKIIFVLVAVLLLGLIFFFPHGRNYRRALEAYKRELLAKGEKLHLADFAPPQITNGMAGDLAAGLSNASTRMLYPLPMMRQIAPGIAEVGHQNLTPLMSASYDANTNRAAQARVLFRNRMAAEFKFDYSGSGVFLLYRLVQAQQALCGTAAEALGARDFSESDADLICAIEVVRQFTDEPSSGTGSIRYGMVQSAIRATWEFLQADRTNVPWAELQTNWVRVDLLGSLESNLKLERAYMLDQFVSRRKGVSPQVAVSEVFRTPVMPGTNTGLLTRFRQKVRALYEIGPEFWRWRTSWAYDEELYGLQLMDCGLTVGKRVEATGAFVPSFANFSEQTTQLFQAHDDSAWHFHVLSNSQILAVSNSLVVFAVMETARRMTVTAIALKRYQLEHHAYPSDLGELIPAYLAKVPADFMDGQPLRYKLMADGNFLLYSVGKDGEDNGGDPAGAVWSNGRDLVWPRAATAKEVEEYNAKTKQADHNLRRGKWRAVSFLRGFDWCLAVEAISRYKAAH